MNLYENLYDYNIKLGVQSLLSDHMLSDTSFRSLLSEIGLSIYNCLDWASLFGNYGFTQKLSIIMPYEFPFLTDAFLATGLSITVFNGSGINVIKRFVTGGYIEKIKYSNVELENLLIMLSNDSNINDVLCLFNLLEYNGISIKSEAIKVMYKENESNIYNYNRTVICNVNNLKYIIQKYNEYYPSINNG